MSDSTKPIAGPEFSYTDALNHLTSEFIKKQREEGKDISKHPLRPSSAGACERELAYRLMEYRKLATYDKELTTPEIQRVFGLGHSVEYHLIKEIKQHFADLFEVRYQQQSLSFIQLVSEHKPEWSSWVEGSLDLVLWSEKHKAVADVKSKKEKFSSYRDSDWTETNERFSRFKSLQKIGEAAFYAEDVEAFLEEVRDPFLAMNVLQLNLYACNPFLVERGIDHCVLLYYSKNTSRLRELRFRPSKRLYDYVLQKFKNAFSAVEQGNPELATKEFNLGSMKCAFCDYKKTCWTDSDPLKAWFRSLPPKSWPKKVSELEDPEALQNLYEEYFARSSAAESIEEVEQDICNALIEQGVHKVRFQDGEVYEVKLYKSPREHYRLKRSK